MMKKDLKNSMLCFLLLSCLSMHAKTNNVRQVSTNTIKKLLKKRLKKSSTKNKVLVILTSTIVVGICILLAIWKATRIPYSKDQEELIQPIATDEESPTTISTSPIEESPTVENIPLTLANSSSRSKPIMEKIPIIKEITMSMGYAYQTPPTAKFLDDENILYHNFNENISRYNIPTDEIKETQVFNNQEISSMVLGPFTTNNREKLSLLISGLSRSSLGEPVYKDIERALLPFLANRLIVLTGSHKDIAVYDSTDNVVLKEPFKYPRFRDIMCIEPKYHLMAIQDLDNNIHIVNFFTREHINTLKAAHNLNIDVLGATFHPSEECLIIRGSYSESSVEKIVIRVWNLKENKPANTSFSVSSTFLGDLELYDNGKFCVASGLKEIQVWDIQKKKRKAFFNVESRIFSMKVFPNGKFLAAAGDFGIKIWHLDSQTLVYTFKLPSKNCASLDFSSNGDRMIATWLFQGNGILVFDNLNAIFKNWLDQYEVDNRDE